MSHPNRNYNQRNDYRRPPHGSCGDPSSSGGNFNGSRYLSNYASQPVFPAYGGHELAHENFSAPEPQFGNAFNNGGFVATSNDMHEMAAKYRQQQLIQQLKKENALLITQIQDTDPRAHIRLTAASSDEEIDDDDIIPVDAPHPVDPTSEKRSAKKDKKNKRKKHSKKHKSKSKKDKRKSKKSRKRKHSSSSNSSDISFSNSDNEGRKKHKSKKKRRRRSSSNDSSFSSSSSASSASRRSISSPLKRKIISELHISKNKWELLKTDKLRYNAKHIVIDDRKDQGNLDMPANPRQTPVYRSLNCALNAKMSVLVLKAVESPLAERYFSQALDAFFKGDHKPERRFRRCPPIGTDGFVDRIPLSSKPCGANEEDIKPIPPEQLRAMTIPDYQAYIDAQDLSLETTNLQGKAKIYHSRCQMNRHDVDAWLNFVRIQKPLFAYEQSGDSEAAVLNMKALRERQDEILNKAIAANPSSVELALERVKTLFDKDAKAEWRRLRNRFINDPKMWQSMITMKQNQRSEFKYDVVIEEIDNCLMHLVDIKDGLKRSHPLLPGTERFLVEKLVHRVRLQREAGFFDSAVVVLQTLTEFHCFAPTLDSKPNGLSKSRVLVSFFQKFFEGGMPRIGDEKARGWRNSTDPIVKLDEEVALQAEHEQIQRAEDEMIEGFKRGNRPTNIETWRRVEIFRSEQYWRPIYFADNCDFCEFSSRFTSFADFSRIFFSFDDPSLATELVFRVAQTLGAVIPGLPDNDQVGIMKQFAGEVDMFPLFEPKYRDLISFFDNYFDLLLTSDKMDQTRVRCAKIATHAKYSIDASKDEKAEWSREIYRMKCDIATKAMCFLEIAKCYELLGDRSKALKVAFMILQGNNIWSVTPRERAVYFEVARWACRRLPFDQRDAIMRDAEEAKPQVTNALYTPTTKLQLLFALGLNGTLNKMPAYNSETRDAVRVAWKNQLSRTTFEPADWFTNENETVAELGTTLFYEFSNHHLRTYVDALKKSPCVKAAGMTAALYEAKVSVFENKMSETTLVSPANRNQLLCEAILAHSTHVALLKKFVDTCRCYEVRKFLLLNPGDDWSTRRVRTCGLIYAEWLSYLRAMRENELLLGHSFAALRLALETGAQQTTNDSDLPDAYLWCLLMYVEQERKSPIRRVDEIFVTGQGQCPWSKKFLLEAAKRRPDASNFAVQLTAILSETVIQKYTSFEEEIDSLYEDAPNEDDDDEDNDESSVIASGSQPVANSKSSSHVGVKSESPADGKQGANSR